MEHPTRARPARYSTRPAQILTINVHSIDDIEWEDLFASTWLSSGQAVHIKCAVRPGSSSSSSHLPPDLPPDTAEEVPASRKRRKVASEEPTCGSAKACAKGCQKGREAGASTNALPAATSAQGPGCKKSVRFERGAGCAFKGANQWYVCATSCHIHRLLPCIQHVTMY